MLDDVPLVLVQSLRAPAEKICGAARRVRGVADSVHDEVEAGHSIFHCPVERGGCGSCSMNPRTWLRHRLTSSAGLRTGRLVSVALLTVALLWTAVNTHRHAAIRRPDLGSGDAGIVLTPRADESTYGEFGYVALTIGMYYQASGATVRNRRIWRTEPCCALLSYMCGAFIAGSSVNVIAGLIR